MTASETPLPADWLKRELDKAIKVWGVGRVADNEKAVLVCFSRPLDDDDLRNLHDYLRKWCP